MIIRHLSIDCAYINKVLEPITQREHGVTEFEIEIKNHGADIDLSECTLTTYYGLKPDGHKVGVECRVDKDKGLIYLPLYLQMTTAEGILKGIVELQFPEGNVRFAGVNFKVSFAPDDTKVESTDDFNILENFISKPTTDGVAGQVLSINNDGNTIWRTLKEFDGDYAHLDNKPSINGVELNGDKSLEDLNIKQTFTADDIPFADGETFQQKFNNGELKGQDGVSGADGITPHIGDNGNWFIGETDTNKPSQGTNGVNGNDGVGITKSEVNTSGELVITYSNGDSTNLGKIVGKDGLNGTNGQNGLSAYEIAKNGGFIGTEEDWSKSLKGEQGEKGQNGADGKTPLKGVDYFTAEDKLEFTAEVTENLKPELAKRQDKVLAEFYKPVSDLDNRKDVDLFISDSYGNVLATFKDGEFITKEFSTVKSIGNNICDTLEECDLAISDVQGNVVFCIVDGNIITPKYNAKNHYKTFSILGDSYSTFKDYTDPLNNTQWYPPSDSATQGSENDVEDVENTWWHLFANDYKSLLIQNNSYSGSCISYDSYGTGTVDGKNFSFVKRCENLKKAELIIIEGGTNDAWSNVPLGEYKYSNWVESDFETFRPACSYVLDYIKRNNIGAKIIFVLNNGLKSSITESIKNICNYYNVDVLELSNIKKSNNHPNIEGMKQIKEQLINFLTRSDFNG